MIAEDIVCINRFAISGREAHPMQEDAVSYRRKRISRKVEIRHRINDQTVRRCDHILQRVGRIIGSQFLERDSFHGLENKVLAMEIGNHIIVKFLLPLSGPDIAFLQPLVEKWLYQLRMEFQHFRHEIFEIDNFSSIFP